jgi:hypothetical protein
MGQRTEISWADATFNPLAPELLAAFQLPKISDAVRLKMSQLVALVAERHSVIDGKRQLWKICHLLEVVCPKISASFIPAVLTGVSVSRENSLSPLSVFRQATKIIGTLKSAVAERIMGFTARRPLSRNLANSRSRFWGVHLPKPVGRSRFCSLTHLAPGFGAHLGALRNHG